MLHVEGFVDHNVGLFPEGLQSYSFLDDLSCDKTEYWGQKTLGLAQTETAEKIKHANVLDISLTGFMGCNAQKTNNSSTKIIENKELLISEQVENRDERVKYDNVTKLMRPADYETNDQFNHQEINQALSKNKDHVYIESNGLDEKIKSSALPNFTQNDCLLPKDILRDMMSSEQKVYNLQENVINPEKNGDTLVDQLENTIRRGDLVSEKSQCNDVMVNESVEMLLSNRSSDVDDTDDSGDDSSGTGRDSNETDDDSNNESDDETDDSQIDALDETMDCLESTARQWQTSAIKLGMSMFDKPPASWKSCSSLSEGKIGIKLQRNKVQDSFSVKSISSNSFSFHSNLTLHSEDPMFEQKVAILEEVQNKQNKDIHSCDMCPREFAKANQLKMHLKTHTGAIKPYKCEDCCRTFKVNLGLTEPFSPLFQKEMLCKASPGPASYPGFHDISGPMPRILPSSSVKLAKDFFCVGNLLGEGGFAKVYSAYWDTGPEYCQDAVLKVQQGGSPDWEWYITNQVQTRIGECNHAELGPGSIWQPGYMSTPSCYIFNTGHILVSQQQHLGTLLDMINLMKEMDKKMSIEVGEPLAIYLIAELLGLVEYLHSVGIVHADIKPDNFLIRFIPGRSNLHSSPCLQLIDFGKSLDLRLLPENTVFDEVLMESDLLKCVEMREGRPWMHHIDYFGIAGIAYCLLFGGYINNNIVKIGGRWGIKGAAYKRWWQVEWKMFFDDLLNVKGASKDCKGCLPSLLNWRNRLLGVFEEKNMCSQLDQLEELLETARRGRLNSDQTQGKTPAKKRKKK